METNENRMLMASTKTPLCGHGDFCVMRMRTGTVLAKVTCGSHGHYGAFRLLPFDENPDISETLNRRRNRFISLSFIGERRNPNYSAGIPLRQFRHL